MAKSNDHVDQHKLFSTSVPKMPENHYAGDKPNPNLRAFVEECIEQNPFNAETDKYEVTPDVGSISTTKRTAIYGLHGYDSKKPHDALAKYIKHFTKEGDLVLDPFIGSGMTAVASLKSERKCIAIDCSPLATFVTYNYCNPVDVNELSKSANRIMDLVEKKCNGLYDTVCATCNDKADIYYTVYSQTYECKRCLNIVTLFDALGNKDGNSEETDFKATCPICESKGIQEKISNRQERKGYVPVLINYKCNCSNETKTRSHNDSNARERQIFNEIDLPKLTEIQNMSLTNWYPQRPMMWCNENERGWGVLWRPYHGEIKRVDHFYTRRNLIALSTLLWAIDQEKEARIRDALRFIFSGFVLSQSKLQRYHPGSTFPNMIAPGLLYVAPMIKEYNSFDWYKGKLKSAIKGFSELTDIAPEKLIISTQSATNLDQIPSNSVDYILTDPPYSGKIQYGELNFIQEAWLNFDKNWSNEEIIISNYRSKNEFWWAEKIKEAFTNCYRVLKPGRWLSLCYHDTSEGTWSLIQDTLAEIGFIAESGTEATFIDAKQKSLKQITADKVTKRDLVINFRKPKPGEAQEIMLIDGTENQQTFYDKVRFLIREFLQAYPGTTKDRIYDDIVSHMVRSGKMEAHNFDEILQQVAEATEGTDGLRWYLKDSSLDIIDAAESAKEDAAAEKINTFITGYLAKHPTAEGVHYSDIFEQFVYTVKDKPRRPLAEWLLDYFFKTDDGTYRLPLSDEEKRLKSEGRSKGTQRRIKRYIAFLQQGVAIPDKERPNDSTLAEWVRHCKRSGLYEQGKLLYEKGGLNLDNLPEEAMVNVEEDYQVCVRLLARGGGAAADAKPKRGRKAKA